jgi:hypothetical protein
VRQFFIFGFRFDEVLFALGSVRQPALVWLRQ